MLAGHDGRRPLRLILALFLCCLSGLAVAQPPVTPSPIATPGLASIGQPGLKPDFPYFPYVNPDAPKGGSVTLAAIGSYDSFNPFILRGTPAGINQIWDSLLRPNADEAATAYGHLAGKIELAPDRSWVAFELRPEARFHDGSPITAQDVAWTFKTLREQGRPFYRAYYADVDNVTTEGDRRVVFHFSSTTNRELPMIIGEMPILPMHWWQGRDFSRPLSEPPLGSGPYRIGHFELGRSVTLQRVPDYWAANLPTARGLANFDSIDTEYFRDATVAMEAFKAGQIDFRSENIAKNWATAYDFPAMQSGLVRKEAIPDRLGTGMQGFAMNTRRKIFQDRRVRQALTLAFDFEWMNKNLFYGAYTRSQSYFSNSDLASGGLPQGGELALLEPYRDKLPPELFTQPYSLPVTDGTGNNREQLRQALALLKQAGWDVKDRKLVDASGTQMEFTILLPDPTYERVALPYVQSLDRLGIAATVRTVDPSQYQHLTDAFDFDMTMTLFPESDVPGNEQRDYWGCGAAHSEGSQNVVGICDPVVDALVEKIVGARDRPELADATHALDRVLLWGWYLVPNWYLSSQRIAYWDRFARPDKTVRSGYVFDDWWIDPARAAHVDAARSGH
jgi:microcin C transport system substrate-binding protein